MTAQQKQEGIYIKLLRLFEDPNNPYVPQYSLSDAREPLTVKYVKCSEARESLLVLHYKPYSEINKETLRKYRKWKRLQEQSQ